MPIIPLSQSDYIRLKNVRTIYSNYLVNQKAINQVIPDISNKTLGSYDYIAEALAEGPLGFSPEELANILSVNTPEASLYIYVLAAVLTFTSTPPITLDAPVIINGYGFIELDDGSLVQFSGSINITNLTSNTLKIYGVHISSISYSGTYFRNISFDTPIKTSFQSFILNSTTSATGMPSLDLSDLINVKTVSISGYSNLTTLILSNMPNLDILQFPNNNIASVDLSSLVSLTNLLCNNNPLITLNLASNIHLQNINASSIATLTSLTLPTSSALRTINISNTSVANINLTTLSNLGTFIANSCPLGTIDISSNPFLKVLSVPSCGLSTLNLTANTILLQVVANNNLLTSLNITTNINIQNIQINNNSLTSLNIAFNTRMTYLNISYNLLSQSAADSIVSSLVSNGSTGGALMILTQTSGVLSKVGASWTALAALGWTIN